MKCSLKNVYCDISKRVQNKKIAKREKEINKLVNIQCVSQPDAAKEIYDSREILANYAKANNVTITMASQQAEDPILAVMVQSSKKSAVDLVNSDVNAIETVEREFPRMLEDSDGCNYLAIGKQSVEDNFIRRVFRAVDTLVHIVNKQ